MKFVFNYICVSEVSEVSEYVCVQWVKYFFGFFSFCLRLRKGVYGFTKHNIH